jgi:hypothetical protein
MYRWQAEVLIADLTALLKPAIGSTIEPQLSAMLDAGAYALAIRELTANSRSGVHPDGYYSRWFT